MKLLCQKPLQDKILECLLPGSILQYKHAMTANKVWYSSFRVGPGANNSSSQKSKCHEMFHRISNYEDFFETTQAMAKGRYLGIQ